MISRLPISLQNSLNRKRSASTSHMIPKLPISLWLWRVESCMCLRGSWLMPQKYFEECWLVNLKKRICQNWNFQEKSIPVLNCFWDVFFLENIHWQVYTHDTRFFAFATPHFRRCNFTLSPSLLRALPSHLRNFAPSPSHFCRRNLKSSHYNIMKVFNLI